MKYYSPLRYPGGKASLSDFIKDLLSINGLKGCNYYEVYAGGAGLGLTLLFEEYFDKIILNDADPHIYSFWHSVLYNTDKFISKVEQCDINIDTWEKQRDVYRNFESHSTFEVGFSTFFLNRCNRSGILHKAGPIGGRQQKGKYLIDARFNKENLLERIQKISQKRDSIEVFQMEGIDFLREVFSKEDIDNPFIYLDPPYYEQGGNLYLNYYEHKDHEQLSKLMRENSHMNWLISYDNKTKIREFYDDMRLAEYSTSYSLQSKKKANEILIFSESMKLPEKFNIYGRESELNVEKV